ncbi:UNVERIFIED_CONTAM: PD-(D/E)XK nuclease family protein [Methylobacteriaceae bacterium AG10]|nr:PD-(D/E)XK nuclease family protein [Methylobacteriaceae bacterium AG10]
MRIADHHEGRVPGPGLYRMPAELYHADPAPEPSLSSSIAKLLVERSPEHAFHAHPRLSGPQEESDPTRPKEIGTAAHKLLLDHGRDLVVVEADDWKTKDAKAARAGAYAAGHCPILRPDLDKAEGIAGRALDRLAKIPGCEGFRGAPSEIVAVARDRSGAWLRIMMDRVEITDQGAIIWDVKTGEQAAAPQGLGRRIENMAMEVQSALYVHVLGLLLPRLQGRILFRWVFVENDPPHALTVNEADATGSHVGERKVALALHRWNASLRRGVWPGYPARIIRAEYPEYAARRWAEREELDPSVAGVEWSLDKSPWRPLNMGDAA